MRAAAEIAVTEHAEHADAAPVFRVEVFDLRAPLFLLAWPAFVERRDRAKQGTLRVM